MVEGDLSWAATGAQQLKFGAHNSNKDPNHDPNPAMDTF